MRPPGLCAPCAAPMSGVEMASGAAGDLRKALKSIIGWLGLACALTVGGCASIYNLPANQPLQSPVAVRDLGVANAPPAEDALLILSFSGGGTRAAAFSFGVLQELERSRIGARQSLLDRVDFVSGVSDGAVTASSCAMPRRISTPR
jgi:NTE family protein